MDRQIEFLQIWSESVQIYVDLLLMLLDKHEEEEALKIWQEEINKAMKSLELFMPDAPHHGYLLELHITATHYANLLYNAGVFDKQ